MTEPRRLPLTRAGCPAERPCPFVSCRHNLFADVTERGSLKLRYHDTDHVPPWLSCALDVAAEGEHTTSEIAAAMRIARPRVELLLHGALAKLAGNPRLREIVELGFEHPAGWLEPEDPDE